MQGTDNQSLRAESLASAQHAYHIATKQRGDCDTVSHAASTQADAEKTGRDPFALAPSRKYPAGMVLFEQGAPVQDVYKLEQGLIKTVSRDSEGREVIIWLCSIPGMYLGAACAISDTTIVSAELVTPCRLRRIPAEVFCNTLKNDAAMSWEFHQAQSKLLWEFVNKLVQFGCHSVQERLEQLLWQLVQAMQPSDDKDEPVRLTMPLKYWEIAELIAVSPEHLCRVIRSMERQGILRRDKGRLIVLEPEKLRHAESGML